MKNMFFPCISFLLSLASCHRGAVEYECRQRWSSLSESRNPVGLSINDQYMPRVLDQRVWFVGPQTKLTGIHLTDKSIQVVPPSPKVRVCNARQRNETYTATDGISLLRFNASSFVWENLYTAPAGDQFDYDDELEIMHGLIPFLQESETTSAKEIYIHHLSGHQTRPLEALSTLLRDSSFRIRTQPKVFVQKDTLLVFIIRRNDNSLHPYEVFSFNLSANKVQARAPLQMQNYFEATIADGNLAAHAFEGFYTEGLSMVNPWNGEVMWEGKAGAWLIYGEALFSEGGFGLFGSKRNPGNNEQLYLLPGGVLLNSLGGIFKDQYCFIGLEDPAISNSPINQIVLVDVETGCETMRKPLPEETPLIGKVLCSEAHQLLIVMDEKGFVHFLSPEEM